MIQGPLSERVAKGGLSPFPGVIKIGASPLFWIESPNNIIGYCNEHLFLLSILRKL